MAKQMVSAAPGTLGRLLALRNLTQRELASQTSIDVKTLRAINRGKPVKESKLKELVQKMRVPLEHITMDITKNETDQTRTAPLDARDRVELKQSSAADLKELLRTSDEISWSLDLAALDSKAKDELLHFEESVSNWQRQLRSEPRLENSLRSQIERLETANEIQGRIKILSDLSIGVFGGQYSRWSRVHYRDPYENFLNAIGYNSVAITILALRHTSIATDSVCVDRGELPPTNFREISMSVYINGQEVWDGRRFKSFPEADFVDPEMEVYE